MRTSFLPSLAGAAALAVASAGAHDARGDEVVGVTGAADVDPAPEATYAPAPRYAFPYEIGGIAAYTSAPIRGGTTPFGIGFGGRLGFRVSGLYLGLAVVDYLGGSDVQITESALLYGGEIGADLRVATLGSASLSLRPTLGLGAITVFRTDPSLASASSASANAALSKSAAKIDILSGATPVASSGSNGGGSGAATSTPDDTVRVTAFYLQPGASLVLAGGAHFVAINGNVLVVPGLSYSGYTTTWISAGTQLQLGLRW